MKGVAPPSRCPVPALRDSLNVGQGAHPGHPTGVIVPSGSGECDVRTGSRGCPERSEPEASGNPRMSRMLARGPVVYHDCPERVPPEAGRSPRLRPAEGFGDRPGTGRAPRRLRPLLDLSGPKSTAMITTSSRKSTRREVRGDEPVEPRPTAAAIAAAAPRVRRSSSARRPRSSRGGLHRRRQKRRAEPSHVRPEQDDRRETLGERHHQRAEGVGAEAE